MMTDYAKRRTKVIRKLKVLAQNKNFGMGAKSNIQYMLQQLPPESQIKTARQRRGAMTALEQAEKSDLYSVSGQRRIAKRKMAKLEKNLTSLVSSWNLFGIIHLDEYMTAQRR